MRTLRSRPDGTNPYFERLNRNKRSVTLDLRKPEAAGVLDALAARADVFVDSFRPSTARRLRVDPETIRARHPHLVCATMTGFGRRGPYVERAAHDINYQGLAGLLRPPALPEPLVGDIGAATQAAIRILAALFQRTRTGLGSIVDVSIFSAALEWSMFPSTTDLASACYNIYETADGRWLALGALESKFWAGFCERIGRPDLIAMQHAPEPERGRLLEEVRAVLRTRTRADWLERFGSDDVCLTAISTPEEAVADPHTRTITPPFSGRAAPALGADTDDLLEQSGIDRATRDSLRAAGVI